MPRMRFLAAALGLSIAAAAPAQSLRNTSFDLLLAARAGNTAQAAELLGQGASPNARNRLGDTPLNIAARGGNVELVPRDSGIRGAIARAEEISRERGAFAPRQFENPDNAEAHRVWTGQEILSQVPGGLVHAVVSGVGTGGTVVGLYQAFAEAGCPVTPFVARPISGLGTDIECCSFSSRVPGVVDGLSRLYREADLPGLVELNIPDELAMRTAQALIRRGFPVGPSSGLNYAAAMQAAM